MQGPALYGQDGADVTATGHWVPGNGGFQPAVYVPDIGNFQIFRNLSDLAEIGSNLSKWAQAGIAGEVAAAEALRGKGYTIVAQHLYVRTPAGLRVTDFVITGGGLGDALAGYEVKVNDSPYTWLQYSKDLFIESGYGTVAAINSPFTYGQPIQYTTYLMFVKNGG